MFSGLYLSVALARVLVFAMMPRIVSPLDFGMMSRMVPGFSGRTNPFHKHWVPHVTNTREKVAPGTFIQTQCGKIYTPWQHKSSCANYVSVNVNEKKRDEVLIYSVYLFTFLPPLVKVWACRLRLNTRVLNVRPLDLLRYEEGLPQEVTIVYYTGFSDKSRWTSYFRASCFESSFGSNPYYR